MRKRRAAASAAFLIAAGSLAAPITAHAAAGATTFYVDSATAGACSDSTADSAATPYCTIQAAVNAATAPGDTVIVAAGNYAPFSVTASGTAAAPITIEGTATSLRNLSANVNAPTGSTTAAVTISGASYVTVKDLRAYEDGNASAVAVSDASHVSLDSLFMFQEAKATSAATEVTSSSYVTMSRSVIGGLSMLGGVNVDGGSNVTVADVVTQNNWHGPGIVITDSPGAAVAGNTVDISCGTGVGMLDGSTGASVENNVVKIVESTSNLCTVAAAAAAGLRVDGTSTAGTTADYNDVYPSSASIAGYAWSGTNYLTASALASATGQGSHDSNSSVLTGTNSVTIDSANADAPGELATDAYGEVRVDDPNIVDTGVGSVTYYDRGATEYGDPLTTTNSNWPTMAPVGATATFSQTMTDSWANTIMGCSFTFSDSPAAVQVAPVDGTCTTTHDFSATGAFIVSLSVSLSDGYVVVTKSPVNVHTVAPFVPAIDISTDSPRGVSVNTARTTDDWNIVSCTFDYGDGTVVTTGTNGATNCDANHTYKTSGTYEVKVTQTDSGGNQASTSESFTTTGSFFTPVAPIRVLDTRTGTGVASSGKVAPNGTVKLNVAGVDGVPSGITAVSLNVTVTNPTGAGFVTVYPDGIALPNASNLNYGPGQTVANTVIAEVGSDGYVDLTSTSSGSTDLVADLNGYYSTSSNSGYTSIAPTRVLDTRVTKTAVPAGGTVKVNLGSYTGISAATLNLTVTDPTGAGFITAYPDGTTLPNASNLNYGPGQTIPNGAVVEVGADGYVDFTNTGKGTTDLVVDLTGYFSTGTGDAYVPITPTRFLDTRDGTGVMVGNVQEFFNGEIGDVLIGGVCPAGACVGEPVPGSAAAIAANITVTEPTANGFISVYPDDEKTAPNTSVVNFAPGQTVANATTVGLGAAPNLGIDLLNASTGNTQLVVDVFGYYG